MCLVPKYVIENLRVYTVPVPGDLHPGEVANQEDLRGAVQTYTFVA